MGHKIFISSDMSVDARLIDVGERSSLAALLWPWLLTAFDDWGRSEASVKRLKAQVFPMLAEVSIAVIDEALQLYAETGLITLYDVDGRRYMAIPSEKWFSYQTHIRSEKRERDSSRYPAPPADVTAQDPASTSSARDCAQVRADARLAGARVSSPSPSPSPSLPVSGKVDSIERENRARGHAVEALTPATPATPHAPFSPSPSKSTQQKAAAPPREHRPGPPQPDARVQPPQPDAREPPPNTDAALWTGMLDGIGHAPITRAERAAWQNWARQLVEARASPDEIRRRCALYRRRYGPEIPLTPKALVEHWSELDGHLATTAAGQAATQAAQALDAAAAARRAEDQRLADEKRRLAQELLGDLPTAAHGLRRQPAAG